MKRIIEIIRIWLVDKIELIFFKSWSYFVSLFS